MVVPVVLGLVLCSLLLGCGSVTSGGGGGGGSSGPSLIYVSTTGSDDAGTGTAESPYRTIQKGLLEIGANGLVSVDAGTYTENVTWPATANVVLRGVSFETVILDGNHAGRCISIETNPAHLENAWIENITIKNGKVTSASYGGAGIFSCSDNLDIHLKNVIVTDCSIEATGVGRFGGGIYIQGNADGDSQNEILEAVNCRIINNHSSGSTSGAAGISFTGILFLSSCEVSGNITSGYFGGIMFTGSGRIENCIIDNNRSVGEGAGIYLNEDKTIEVVNCTITTNETNDVGGGLYSHYCKTKLINTIIWNNGAASATTESIYLDPVYAPGAFKVNYCDISGSLPVSGTGNLDVDPLFTSTTDFHVGETALDTATTEGAPAVDYSGTTRSVPFTIGAYEHTSG
jgi:hypothetical protein